MFVDFEKNFEIQEPPEIDGEYDQAGGFHTKTGGGYDPLGMECTVCKKGSCIICPIWQRRRGKAVRMLLEEENGHVHIFPCNPGDPVWWIEKGRIETGSIQRFVFERDLWADIKAAENKLLSLPAARLYSTADAAKCALQMEDVLPGITEEEANQILQMSAEDVGKEDIVEVLRVIRRVRNREETKNSD